ncbi:MAG: M1 family peptidase, partial [Calditrichaeota bacterium]
MDVRLNVDTRRIQGKEILTWTNRTDFPATDLQFHLYYNAWRNDRSSFLSSVRYRGWNLSQYREDDWAYCNVTSMRILPQGEFVENDVTNSLEYIQPDDGNPHDRTVLRLPLHRPVYPGETIALEIVWESKVPRPFSRTGAIDDYFFIAQWFPKIGVFEEGAWNCHQFIQTEFYADYGVYDVRLTVPTGWVVGATGRELERIDNGDGTTTHRYYQEDVHDFVWVTTPHFHEFHRRFEEPGLPPVEMRLLLMPYNLDKRDRYFDACATALKYYGTWFGPYPYGHITIVDPAYQSRSGGMEYPTLFTGGTHWLSPPETRSPESVTIHEAGHQFWYGIVGNNEFEHAWLDEGFNTYSQHRIFREHFPPPVLYRRYFDGFIPVIFSDVQLANRIEGADRYYGFQSPFKTDAMAVPSYRYAPGAYRVNSYDKPAMMLHTLENYLGWETFQKIMSTYFQRYKFKHPRPEDFFHLVDSLSGQDMGWFFRDAYYSSYLYDYAVDQVSCEPVAPIRGYREVNGELLSPEQVEAAEKEESPPQYRCRILIRRWGEARFPIEIKMTFANGEEVTESWDGQARWKEYEYIKPARLEKVEVDPEHKLALDVNYSNNSWIRESKA